MNKRMNIKDIKVRRMVSWNKCDNTDSFISVCCGYGSKVYRDAATKLWVSRVGWVSIGGLESKESAIELSEQRIKQIITDRFKKAKSDLAMFEKNGITFNDAEDEK